MQQSFLIILFSLIIFQLNAQIENTKKIEYGVLFSPRIDSNDDFGFKIKGLEIEGGYYFLKKVGKKVMLSIDIRLAYAQSERNYTNILKIYDSFPFPDTTTRRMGTVDYKNFSLAIPIKYRYQFSNKLPLFFLIGANPYFNLANNTTWNFDEFEYDTSTNTNVSEIKNQEEALEQSFFSRDLILAGFGYKKDKLMFDLYFSGGSINFDSEFIQGMDKLSIVFNAYYRLN